MEDQSKASDTLESKIESNPFTPVRKSYRVVAEAGLTKRGMQYPVGSSIDLDEKTAANFIATGDIAPIEEVQTNA